MKTKQIIVMRKDLGMRKGKMIAQGAHASMKVFLDHADIWECAQPTSSESIGVMMVGLTRSQFDWLTGRFTKVCFSANSEEELLDIYKKATEIGLPRALIEDSGLTEFKQVPTKTCCAIGPAEASLIDPLTRHLPLL